MKHDQFTLPFLDTTSLGGGLGLYSGFPTAGFPTAKSPALPEMTFEPEEAEVVDAPDPTKPAVPAHDYRLAGDRRLAQGWKARAKDNLAAIRLMTAIEAEARHARPDEQEQLAKFTGFGATDLADKLFRRAGEGFAPAWEDLGLELEELVSREDLANLKRATQYAHFTPEFMIRAIWRALSKMGFDGGRVLEPGCGTGLFFALAPEALAAKLALTGVEMDAVTARIAKLLYPNARIRHEDFTKARLPDVFDLAIGNPPFSDRTVRADDPAGELRLSLHDYFIARSIERLRPGGLAAFVTSRWTMDKVDQTAREHIASMADLIGAVRLAEGAMHATAGTDVVVDILFLQEAGCGSRSRRRGLGRPRRSCPGRRRRGGARDQPLLRRSPRNGPWGPRPHLQRLRAGLYVPARPRDRRRARRPSHASPRPAAARPLQADRALARKRPGGDAGSTSGRPPRARPSRRAAISSMTARSSRSSTERRSRSPSARAKEPKASRQSTPGSSAD